MKKECKKSQIESKDLYDLYLTSMSIKNKILICSQNVLRKLLIKRL